MFINDTIINALIKTVQERYDKGELDFSNNEEIVNYIKNILIHISLMQEVNTKTKEEIRKLQEKNREKITQRVTYLDNSVSDENNIPQDIKEYFAEAKTQEDFDNLRRKYIYEGCIKINEKQIEDDIYKNMPKPNISDGFKWKLLAVYVYAITSYAEEKNNSISQFTARHLSMRKDREKMLEKLLMINAMK